MLRHLLLMKTSPYGCDALVAVDIWLARDANTLASGGYVSIPTSSQHRSGRAQAAPQINHEDIPATQMRLVSAGGQPLDRDVAPTEWERTLAKLDAPLALTLRKTFSSATCLTTQTRKLLGRQQRPRARQLRRRHCRTPPPPGMMHRMLQQLPEVLQVRAQRRRVVQTVCPEHHAPNLRWSNVQPVKPNQTGHNSM